MAGDEVVLPLFRDRSQAFSEKTSISQGDVRLPGTSSTPRWRS